MKYKDLLNFEPITEVVKFSQTNKSEYQQSLVKTFVFSDAFKESRIPLMVKNLDFHKVGESFGLQVVGNYGTGKSHLMSLISLIAENEDLLNLITDERPKMSLQNIAGKFKVLRFELGNSENLWTIISYKIEEYLLSLGINFSFDGHGPISYFDKIQLMMAEFEEKYPNQGFLIVVDEMLAYLKGRSAPDKLNSDLQVLQALGQACDGTRFKFIFGVQEMIYQSPEFQFAAEMLQKVNDRYKDILITKDDVAYIVKNRLLKKNEHQKQKIKNHLDPFLKLFTDMHGRTQDYVELFPVHPSYFENFERIRIGKSQREILKTLSNQFNEILEKEVPSNNPGLLTYDQYWRDIQKEQDLLADPDIRKVKQITDTISDKIDSYFTGARTNKKEIALRICNACAIKVLQHELTKQNGTNTEHLVDDLCPTDILASDREFLIDIIDTTATQIISATSGQYFDKDQNSGEYHLRIEGGINFDQKIKDYAANMSDANKDEYFFKFLEVNLPLDHDTYRTGFRIWEHAIEWKSHKTYRDGYIFFGNPNEKSTTQPKQHFYMYFMPIFSLSNRNNEADEVYFIMNDLSLEYKNAVALYGAALALEVRADSSQKPIYKQKIQELNKKARAFFDQEYIQITKVIYQGKELPLSGYQLPGAGASKEQIFSEVASRELESWFNNETPHYPKFTQLNFALSKDNFDRTIKQGLSKIANPLQQNKDGEGILSGLGLWVPGMLDYSHSPYAKNILQSLKEKGEGKVLNRDEIIECLWAETNLWVSKDFSIEAALEFLVLATLAALGEIEINLSSGKSINSNNLNDLLSLDRSDFFTFTHVKAPKGLNLAALKAMFIGIMGNDASNHLKDPSTYTKLVGKASEWANRTVTILSKIQNGVTYNGIEIINTDEVLKYRIQFTPFGHFCDKLTNYTSEAKIKNFPFSLDEVQNMVSAIPELEKVENQLREVEIFKTDISYLQQCRQYITESKLKSEIDQVTNKLGEVLGTANPALIDKYKKELEKLKNDYADWYLALYLKYRISESDFTKKQVLLDSDEKIICDVLKDADFLSTGQYQQLMTKINKLLPANSKVNKELILNTPYQDFNPLDYVDQKIFSIKELKESLNELLEDWIQILKNTLDDPMVQKKINLLDVRAVDLLGKFKSGMVGLSKENALIIRDAIMDLHKGLEKVELSLDDMKSSFNKPLTPDEAIEAFKTYIDQIAKGKERDKIRIILK